MIEKKKKEKKEKKSNRSLAKEYKCSPGQIDSIFKKKNEILVEFEGFAFCSKKRTKVWTPNEKANELTL